MSGSFEKNTSLSLCDFLLENIGNCSAIKPGSFLLAKDDRLAIPGGALKDSYMGTWFHVDFQEVPDIGNTVARISTNYWVLSRDAVVEACAWYETARYGVLDNQFCVFADVTVDEHDHGGSIADICDVCLVLDGVIATAAAFDIKDNPGIELDHFDSMTLFSSYGFEQSSREIADSFEREMRWPVNRAMANYALPYNLQRIAESGVIDAVIAENGNRNFGLHSLAWRRWFYCCEIVQSLQRRGFSNEQIAYIVIHDEDLFDIPESRQAAEQLCGRIEATAFDPEDIERWSDYTATETGPLAGFL